jgi:recombination protein RecA
VDSAELSTVEDFFEDVEALTKTKTKQPMLYILDSLDSISSRAELARDIDQGSYGTERAKQLSQLFRRRIPAALDKANITLLIVSQTRDKVGALIGTKWTVAGGNALKFYASQRLLIDQLKRLSKTVRGIKRAEGILVKAQCIKNKIALPFRDCEFAIKFGYGIDDLNECLDFLATVDGLKEIQCTKTGIKKYLDEMKKLDDTRYWARVDTIDAVVEKHWYAVEAGFLPKRRKYI